MCVVCASCKAQVFAAAVLLLNVELNMSVLISVLKMNVLLDWDIFWGSCYYTRNK